MPVPDYQTLMLPLLSLADTRGEMTFKDAVRQLAQHYQLSSDEANEMLPSGNQPVFTNRVGWARSYLKQAGLLSSPRRGVFVITAEGKSLLAEKPARIDNSVLSRFTAFQAFKSKSKSTSEAADAVSPAPPTSIETPEDALSTAYQQLRRSLESDLLDQVKSNSPSFFERVVVDLLVAMGYGGSRNDAGRAVGRSGDGGIDGVINEDRLGLDVIYLQAKRWEGVVGRPEIQKFAGALQGQRAQKGVFITTSSFTREAVEYAQLITTKIILIDGERLASLMAEHNVGVSRVGFYEIKRIDTDYFEEE
ncbi:MAG: restriction endonuclease [Inhella sp.]|jgi:restriction system protein|uniref:restriction endonuclease n=1 Tax=Inhella sp. TaxID=1921806 RepID=UPI0022C1B77B|nr:restriction endonuclease [Inhella sp.]MCZ8233748.1 restriction endonuclease [Inhella sp.]